MSVSKPLTYISYLKIDELLQLQVPRSEPVEHDEHLFIVIHQVYELWFRQLLHEVDYLCGLLRAGEISPTLHTLRRMLTILKTVVAQVDVLETMTPLEFNSFRTFLESASGFQSVQFRELEFALGHKRENLLRHFSEAGIAQQTLQQRYEAPTLWDAFLVLLCSQGFEVPPHILGRDVRSPIVASSEVQALLIQVYRSNHAVMQVCERLVDFDEGLQEWRYRHVKMVERTIGSKPGTGGSPGVKYLAATIAPIFPDLWAIRSAL